MCNERFSHGCQPIRYVLVRMLEGMRQGGSVVVMGDALFKILIRRVGHLVQELEVIKVSACRGALPCHAAPSRCGIPTGDHRRGCSAETTVGMS